MKKILIILITILLTGCKNYTEINDLGVVSSIAIDYKDEQYKITSQLIINDTKTEIKVYETESKSIEEGIAQISKLSNKEIFLSKLKLLLITENIIKEKVNIYDFFLRDAKSNMDFYIYLVDENNIKDILSINNEQNGSALYIQQMMTFNERNLSSSTKLDFMNYVYKSLEKGINIVYPTISIEEESVKLSNLSSFNYNNNKLDFNENESIFFNMITNKTDRTIFSIPCEDKEFTLELQDIKTKYKWDNNIFNINMSLTGKIKNYNCRYNINDNKTEKILTNITNIFIENNMNNLINLMKKNNNDFLGIGNYIYKHDKNYFNFDKDIWDNHINELNINSKSNANIISIGEIRK